MVVSSERICRRAARLYKNAELLQSVGYAGTAGAEAVPRSIVPYVSPSSRRHDEPAGCLGQRYPGQITGHAYSLLVGFA